MRMAGPDIVLFVVGLLLFSGAGYAIITSDEDLSASGSASGVFNVAWTTSEAEIATEGIDSFRDATLLFTIETLNVSLVTFTIDCQDPAGTAVPFQLTITVTSPNGTSEEPSTAACAPGIVVDFAVADVPPATVARGSTPDAAREDLAGRVTSSAALGEWTLTITGDRSGAPVLPVPVGEPTGSATLSVQTWEPAFTPVPR